MKKTEITLKSQSANVLLRSERENIETFTQSDIVMKEHVIRMQ